MLVKDIIANITPEIQKEMETIWFTADLHQGHPKIVDICNRPVYIDYDGEKTMHNRDYKYLLSKAHDEWLVKEIFNKYVLRKHSVYLLGDVSLAKRPDAERFLDRLNGNKFLILGNHDANIDTSTRFSQIIGIKDFKFKRGKVDIHIALAHYPMASWNKKPHGAWHLYGHVHGRFKNTGLSLDVGIDNSEVNFRPINLYEVALIMAKKEEELGLGVYYDNGVD